MRALSHAKKLRHFIYITQSIKSASQFVDKTRRRSVLKIGKLEPTGTMSLEIAESEDPSSENSIQKLSVPKVPGEIKSELPEESPQKDPSAHFILLDFVKRFKAAKNHQKSLKRQKGLSTYKNVSDSIFAEDARGTRIRLKY